MKARGEVESDLEGGPSGQKDYFKCIKNRSPSTVGTTSATAELVITAATPTHAIAAAATAIRTAVTCGTATTSRTGKKCNNYGTTQFPSSDRAIDNVHRIIYIRIASFN